MVDIEKCRITHYPAAVLGKRAEPVDQINDNIRQLADKMIDIMIETGGVGLAGPQAGVGLSIFVASTTGSREDAKVYINPTITPKGNQITSEEGCLSVPHVCTKVKRFEQCEITATDLEGNEFTEEADGLLARIFQHENDHLEGITIIDRMGSAAKITNRKHLKTLREAHENP